MNFKKIQIGSKSQKITFSQIIFPVTQKQTLQSKKVQERNPPKMTQIIIKNHKNRNFFFHSIKKNSTGPGAASHEYFFFQFFLVLLET